jgi:hypothetical protein
VGHRKEIPSRAAIHLPYMVDNGILMAPENSPSSTVTWEAMAAIAFKSD